MMQRRKLENVLLKAIIVLLSVTFIYLGSAFLLGKNARSLLVDTLNNELQVKVNVKHIELDVLSNFPLIAIRFHNLCIDESYSYYNDCLLNAPELTMTFSPFKLFGKKLEVQRLYIEKGKIKLYADNQGNANFNIFKPSDDQNNNTDLEIRQIRLIKTNIQYYDPLGLSTNFSTGELGLNFRLNDQGYRLKLSGNTYFDHLMYDDMVYLFGRRLSVNGQFQMSAGGDHYQFETFRLRLDELPLEADGSISIDNGNPNFNLSLSGNKLELVQFFSLLPLEIQQKLPQLSSTGSLGLHAHIKGLMSDNQLPEIDVNFNLKNATLLQNGQPTGVEEIELNGQWTQKGGQTAFDPQWKINLVKAVLGNDRIKGSVEKEAHSNWINWKLNGRIHLQRLNQLLATDDQLSGDIQLNMMGMWPTTDSMNSYPEFQGDIVAGNLRLPTEWTGISMKLLNADLHFETNSLQVNKLYAQNGQSDFLFKGKVENYRTLFSSTPALKLKGEWTSNYFNPDDVMSVLSADTTNQEQTENNFNTDSIVADVRIIINRLQWDSLQLNHLKSNLKFGQSKMLLDKISCTSMGGQWLASAKIDFSGAQTVIQSELQCKEARIEQIFHSLNNFGQEEITDRQISGKLNASVVSTMPLDPNGDIIPEQIELSAYLTIIEGRIKDYPTLYALSNFVHIEDLKDIRFDTLENSLHISEGLISFPEMSIRNSALSLNLAGEHHFNNGMKYHMSVEVGELLAAKARWIEKLQNDKIEKRNNRMKVYLQLKGTPDDLKITYDRKSAAADIKNDINEKGQKLREKIKAAANEKETEKKHNQDWWDD